MIDFQDYIERTLIEQNDEDSHVEKRHDVFHPSQLANCERQCVISKYGLEEHDTKTLGTFHVGTMIHEWMEEQFEDSLPGVEFEKPVEQTYTDLQTPVTITGRCDVYDSVENVVTDFKTRGGWYKFNPPSERHVDQLTLYMDALNADSGQVVYINKKNMEVRTWPEDGTFDFDQSRLNDLLQKAQRIAEATKGNDIESVDDVPFEKCDCWICSKGDGS